MYPDVDYDYFSTVSFSPETCYLEITPKLPICR